MGSRVHPPTLATLLISCFLVAAGDAAAATSDDLRKTIDRLAKTLAKSKDPAQRADAAERLTWEVPEVVPPLVGALADPVDDVREAAARSLWKVSKVAEPARGALQKALNDVEPAVAIAAAGALEAMGVPEAELKPTFERVLASAPQLRERFLAARGLIGLVPGPRVLPVVLEYLEQQDRVTDRRYRNVDIAKTALTQLVTTKDAALAAALLSALSSTEAVTREAILRADHGAEYAKRMEPGLVRVIQEDSDKDVKLAALGLATALEPPSKALLAACEKAMKDPDESVRNRAAMAVNRFQHHALEGQIKQAKGVEGVQAALAAAATSGPAAGLIKTLRTGSTEQDRAQAAQALSAMSVAADAVAPALAEAVVKDPSAKVRFRAASSLADLNSVRDSQVAVIKTLLQGLNREQGPSARVEIYRALWKHARHNPEAAALAVPVLEAALQDPEEGVREQAKEGLTWLKR